MGAAPIWVEFELDENRLLDIAGRGTTQFDQFLRAWIERGIAVCASEWLLPDWFRKAVRLCPSPLAKDLVFKVQLLPTVSIARRSGPVVQPLSLVHETRPQSGRCLDTREDVEALLAPMIAAFPGVMIIDRYGLAWREARARETLVEWICGSARSVATLHVYAATYVSTKHGRFDGLPSESNVRRAWRRIAAETRMHLHVHTTPGPDFPFHDRFISFLPRLSARTNPGEPLPAPHKSGASSIVLKDRMCGVGKGLALFATSTAESSGGDLHTLSALDEGSQQMVYRRLQVATWTSTIIASHPPL